MLNPRAKPAVAMEAMIAIDTAACALLVVFIVLKLLSSDHETETNDELFVLGCLWQFVASCFVCRVSFVVDR